MGQSVVLPAKHQSEIHQFVADFNTLLTPGDSILAGTLTVTVTLATGTDPSPQAILVPGPSIIGNVVSQGLQQGVVGCIYTIVIQVNTTLGNVVNMNARLAILKDEYPAGGAFISYYFTSYLYPLLNTDTAHSSVSIHSALVDTLVKNYSFFDTARVSANITRALVNSQIQNYTLIDTARMASSSISSALVNSIVQNYSFNDSAHNRAAIISANITTVIVLYNFSDTAHSTASITSAKVT